MKKLFLIFLLFPFSAQAENISLKYDGYWEGIKAGEASFQNVESGDGYKIITEEDTTGIVKTLTNFTSHTVTTGRVENGEYIPAQYDSKWQNKKNAPRIIVNYTANREASEIADPPENRHKRPEVAQQFKQNSFDLASTFLNARNQVRGIIESGAALPQTFQIKVFDARRVFNANFTVVGYQNKKLDGKQQKLLHITLNRSAIAGFTKGELEKIKNFNPTFDLWLDNDYIPLMGYGQAVIGHAEMRLASVCKGDGCGR